MSSWKRGSIAVAIVVASAFVLVHSRPAAPRAPARGPTAEHEERAENGNPSPAIPALVAGETPHADRMVIAGLVTTATGSPAEEADVVITTSPPLHMTTAFDGTFEVADVPAGIYDVSAEKGDFVAGPVQVTPTDARGTLVLKLHGAPLVHVHVADRATGAAIASARVELAQARASTALSDGAGDASLHAASAGGATLGVTADGYAPAWRAIALTATQGGVQSFAVGLERGAEVRGRVVDVAGRPVEGAHVAPLPAADVLSPSHTTTSAITGPDGRFRFAALSRGVYRFAASAPSLASSESRLVRVGDRGADGVEIRLEPEGRLAGTVVLSSGAPASLASVRIARHGAGHGGEGPVLVATDGAGHFEARGLARAALDVFALSGSSASSVHRIDLTSRSSVEGIQLTLDAGRAIAGVVVDTKQRPVGQVYVTALPTGDDGRFAAESARGLPATTTRADGAFTIAGLREGRYTLRTFWAPEDATRASTAQREGIDVSAGTRNVTLVVRGNGAITGTLRTSDGRPVGAFQAGTEGTATSAFDGETFRLEGVTAGTRTVRIAGASFASKTLDVEVEADSVVDLGVITVDTGRTIRGRVVDARGQPAPSARVFAAPRIVGGASSVADASLTDAYRIRSTASGADGSFVLSGLDDAPSLIVAERDDAKSIPEPAPMGDAPIELTLVASGSVEGKVTTAEAPVAGALVTLLLQSTLKPSGAMLLAATTGKDGSYAFDAVPPGRYSAFASLGGNGTNQKSIDRREIDVHASEPTTVDFRVQSTGVELVITTDPVRQPSLRGAMILLSGATVYTSAVGMAGPSVLSDVAPGAYHLCIFARPQAPPAKSDSPPPAPRCRDVRVDQAPKTQEVSIDE